MIRKPRDDRRIDSPPLTPAQRNTVDFGVQHGGSYEGLYEGKPVVRREGTKEGGIGPYAAIYDWVDETGSAKNLQVETPSGHPFDESKWDRQAPIPRTLSSTQDTQIKIDPRPKDKDTLLHELSHRLEIVYGEENAAGYTPISMATHAFLNRRTRGEEAKRLQELYPGYAYEEHEWAKPDKFVDGYIGKQYPGPGDRGADDGHADALVPQVRQARHQQGPRDAPTDPRTAGGGIA